MGHGIMREKEGGVVTFEGFLPGKIPCYSSAYRGSFLSIICDAISEPAILVAGNRGSSCRRPVPRAILPSSELDGRDVLGGLLRLGFGDGVDAAESCQD